MHDYTVQAIPPGTTTIVSPTATTENPAHRSNQLRVVYNRTPTDLAEPQRHLHTESTEVYLVFQGELVLEVADEQVTLRDHEVCTVGPMTPHRIINSSPQLEAVVIRAPGSPDRVTVE